MSNSKISALTSATTPLAGTEVLPVVQGSTTKQVSVANLTDGRDVTSLTMRALGTLTGATTKIGIRSTPVAASDVTSNLYSFYSDPTTSASVFTLGNLTHYRAVGTAVGAGSTVTNQFGFYADSGITGATNNYGFYGNIASGTGRYNFYAAGTADNYFAGSLGLAGTSANTRLRANLTVSDIAATTSAILGDGSLTLTANNANAFNGVEAQAALNQGAFNATISLASGGSVRNRNYVTVTGASGTVTAAVGALSDVRNLGTGTLTNAAGFVSSFANSGGGTLTNTYGFYAGTTTAGTNNYGFYGGIASGTGQYNLYMAGTAENYLAGGLTIGRSAVTAPATTDGNVFSGTYTPTLFNTTNVAASTAYECQYLRVGNTVTVSGQVDIDPTLSLTDTVLGMSLPIASALAAVRQLGGAGAIVTPGRYGEGTAISADLTNDRAQFLLRPSSVNNSSYTFSFTYRVI